MSNSQELTRAYEAFKAEATALAGGLRDLAKRAAVYRHVYDLSGGNHVFPLIAAHGALWAGGHFAFGMKLGRVFSFQFARRSTRCYKMQQLEQFADAFRNVNRLVCIETYTTFKFTELYGDLPEATDFVASELLEQLSRVHRANQTGSQLTTAQKRRVFETFFMNEQKKIVGPLIGAATDQFDWTLMRFLALMPRVRFLYQRGWGLQFTNFSSESQRVRNGLRAFDHAADAGWPWVEQTLESYQIALPIIEAEKSSPRSGFDGRF